MEEKIEERLRLATRKICSIVREEIDPRPSLVALSRYVLQIVELDNPCFCYVIPYSRLSLGKRGHVACVFLKTVDHRRVAVFDTHCWKGEEALSFAREKLANFGLYLFSSRFWCDPDWQRR